MFSGARNTLYRATKYKRTQVIRARNIVFIENLNKFNQEAKLVSQEMSAIAISHRKKREEKIFSPPSFCYKRYSHSHTLTYFLTLWIDLSGDFLLLLASFLWITAYIKWLTNQSLKGLQSALFGVYPEWEIDTYPCRKRLFIQIKYKILNNRVLCFFYSTGSDFLSLKRSMN
jgi:hypothetical protein